MTTLTDRIRRDFPAFQDTPAAAGHFLDSGASAQIPAEVIDAMAEHDRSGRANVHRGVYALAEKATESFEAARQSLARYLNAPSPNQVILTGGATAAFNLVADSFVRAVGGTPKVTVSVLEHHANLVPWLMRRDRGEIELAVAGVTADGRIDLDDLEQKAKGADLVSVTHVSNVTGAETDVARVRDIARANRAAFMLDGAQAAPHGPLDVQELGVDFYIVSGHKMYGPTGIGVLYGAQEWLERMPPAFGGGEMIRRVDLDRVIFAEPPHKFEAGTPPITQAVGLGAAARYLERLDWPALARIEKDLTEQALSGLSAIPGVRIIGPSGTQARRGLVSFDLENVHPHDVSQVLSDHNVAVRGGHHCAQPFMTAMDLIGTSRAGIGIYTNSDDITALCTAVDEARRQLS